ncbi:MAG: Ig-like domain-containing protein, partial [Candidatus Aenigmarchaeota archaeon]|nr:Ig-like domain-containing protein [Candidatus Aenigmarchaeota archaeon]
MKSSVGTPQRKKAKSTIGQSELLASVMFMALVSTIVVAQNISYYNSTQSITSSLIEGQEKTIQVTKEIEVWAGSSISLDINETVFRRNESILIQASLLLDNSSSLSNQTVDFYIDSSPFSSITSVESEFQIEIPSYYLETGTHEIKAVFNGAGYINGSQSSVQIEVLAEGERALEIKYSELAQGQVTIRQPVNWTQEIQIYNPNNSSFYNYTLALDVPEDAFDSRINGMPVGGSGFVIGEIIPQENKTFILTFSTLPVEIEVRNETLNLEELIPEEAFGIKVYKNSEVVAEEESK